jgi:hypothetical protein
MGAHAKKARRPVEPWLIASEHVPVWACLRNLRSIRRRDAEDAVLYAVVDPKPCCVPRIRGPIKKRNENENHRQTIVAAKQAQAEFAALIVEEKKIASRRDDDDRPPHGGKGLQGVQERLDHHHARGDGAKPHAEPKEESGPACCIRVQMKPACHFWLACVESP